MLEGSNVPADRKSAHALAPEWAAWITENLLRGASRDRVIEGLVARGVARVEAQRHVDEIAGSPILAGARAAVARTRKLDTIARLMRRVAREAHAPDAIPRVDHIDGPTFFDTFYSSNQPVVITGLTSRWPARTLWTPEQLAARLGHVEVEITDDRERDVDYDMNYKRHSRTIRIDALTRRIRDAAQGSNDFYVVANNRNMDRPELAPLYDDIVWPEEILDPAKRRGSVAFWYGPMGTVTPLHHDTCNILFCQIYGRKRFTLISPFETAVLDGARAMYASLDPEQPTFPADVQRRVALLGPGDTLFIPVGWWHHVRSLDPSISIAFANFRRPNNLDWYRPGSA